MLRVLFVTAIASLIAPCGFAQDLVDPRPITRRALDPELFGYPKQTVVLLTSLNMREIPLFLRETVYAGFFGRLEGLFRAQVGNRDLRVRVIHEADQYDLWSSLQDPSVVGLIWLSHGGPNHLVDYQSFDVLPAFQGVHPNLRFLGVVGCHSAVAMTEYLERTGVTRRNPHLVFHGFEGTTQPEGGLQEVVQRAFQVLDQPEIRRGYRDPCPVQRGYGIRIQRRIDAGYSSTEAAVMDLSARAVRRRVPALRIQTRDRVLDVLPPSFQGGVQQRVINFPVESTQLRTRELNLSTDVGENFWRADRPLAPGILSFTAPWSGSEWVLAASQDGSPVGVTRYLYRYTGPLNLDVEPEEYRPFVCQDVPARLR